MALPFLFQLAVGIGLQVLGYIFSPKPKPQKPPSVSDLENPTAEAGRPIPVVFGSVTVASPNNNGYWDKAISTRKVGGKK